MTFRLTFNKPTIARNFDGEKVTAVRIKIENGIAMFLPVTEPATKDVLPISVRGRGGGEAFVDGVKADELRAALQNPHGPFFTLHRKEGGWLAAVPWTREGAPPKPEPHLRTWSLDGRATSMAKTPEVNPDTLSSFLNMVTDARELVSSYDANRRPGRPPRDIVQARENLALFDRLSHEVLARPDATPAAIVMKRVNRKPLDKPRATARAYSRAAAFSPKGIAPRFRSRLAEQPSQ